MDANSHTDSRASQKLGTAMPATENVITEPSAQLLRLTAANMPSGTPMTKTSAKAAAPSIRLLRPCSVSMSNMSALLVSDLPRSNVSSRPM